MERRTDQMVRFFIRVAAKKNVCGVRVASGLGGVGDFSESPFDMRHASNVSILHPVILFPAACSHVAVSMTVSYLIN
jgi:hypothetical protein